MDISKGERGNMKRLPNKELSEVEYMESLRRIHGEPYGTEGFVILGMSPHIARKLFYHHFGNYENKLQKLAQLYQVENFFE